MKKPSFWEYLWEKLKRKETSDYLFGAAFYMASVFLALGSLAASSERALFLALLPPLALGLWGYMVDGKRGLIRAWPLWLLPLGVFATLVSFSRGFSDIVFLGTISSEPSEEETLFPFGLVFSSLILANASARLMLHWALSSRGGRLARVWAEASFLLAPLVVPLFLAYLFPLLAPPRKEEGTLS